MLENKISAFDLSNVGAGEYSLARLVQKISRILTGLLVYASLEIFKQVSFRIV